MSAGLRVARLLAILFGAVQAALGGFFLLLAATMGPATAGWTGEVFGGIAFGVFLTALPLLLMRGALRAKTPRVAWIFTASILALTALTWWFLLKA